MASSITEQLRAAAINDLNELIETLSPNRKRLYIDESLYSALPQISADFATANNIECSVKLEDVNFDSVVVGRDMPEVLVFIVRPETTQVKMIAVQVRTVLAASDLRRRQFHVIFVPQRSVLAQQVLEVSLNKQFSSCKDVRFFYFMNAYRTTEFLSMWK